MLNIGGVRLDKEQAVIDGLPEGEEARAVVSASKWLAPTQVWSSPTILLTDRRVIVIKSRIFGQPKIDAEVLLVSVDSSGSGPAQAFGTWTVAFTTRSGEEYGLIFSRKEEGVAFEEQLREATNVEQGRAVDLLDRLQQPKDG